MSSMISVPEACWKEAAGTLSFWKDPASLDAAKETG